MGGPQKVAKSRPWLTPRLGAFCTASGLSLLGDQMFMVALAWQIYRATGSAAIMGVVLVAQAVPNLAGLLVGGVLADRFDRRRFIASTSTAGALLAALVSIGFAQHTPFWSLLLFVAAFGAADGLMRPAVLALPPVLVAESHVQRLNGLFQIAKQGAVVVGPAAGALTIALFGTAGTMLLDAVTFLLLAGTALFVRAVRAQPKAVAVKTFRTDLVQGFRYVFAQPLLLALTLVGCLFNFADYGALYVGLPKLAAIALGAGATGLGAIFSAFGAGTVVGAIATTALPTLRRRGLFLGIAMLVQGLLLAACAAPRGMPGLMLLLFGYGLMAGPVGVILITLLQELSQSDALGRVLAAFDMGTIALIPASYALTGLLVQSMGVRPVLAAAGSGVVVIALGWLALPMLRKTD